jgi:cytochrome c2
MRDMDTTSSSERPRRARKLALRALLLVLALGVVAGSFYAGVLAHRNRAAIRARLGRLQESSILQTSLYNLRVESIVVPAEGRDGGIAPLGDGILFVNRLGRFWYVDAAHAQHPLELRVPINLDEFEADPYNENTVNRQLFGVKDLHVEEDSAGLRVYVSHNHWIADQDCYALRISRLETTRERLLANAPATWSTVYETRPCRPLTTQPDGVHHNPTLAAGGRMISMPGGRILVTVGGFGPETDLTGGDPDAPFGKTILVDPATGESRAFTAGHRNPQGLALAPDGTIWLTEHGDRGGDELNRLRDGVHYGYPFVSYGTAYGTMTWPPNPEHPGRHDGFEKPIHVWTPGVGISQPIVIGATLPHWENDVLVASLSGLSLFRVRVEDGRAIFAERIPVEHRIRDLTQAANGAIVLKTDDSQLIYLTAVGVDPAADRALSPTERGAVVASQCMGCHTMTRDGASAIGPTLWGVAGRDIGSAPGYAYSDALRTRPGDWSSANLRAYLAHPDSFAPGTTMLLPQPLDSAQIADLVTYLETLR